MEKNHKLVLSKNKDLNDDLKQILGRANFQCGAIARRLREKGLECKPKAEEEQALVIHTMLTFYNEYGDSWRAEFNAYLKK